MSRRALRIPASLLCLVFAFALCSPSRADWSWDDFVRQRIPRADFVAIVEMVSPDPEVQLQLRQAYDDYARKFARVSAPMSAEIDRLRAGGQGSSDALLYDWWEGQVELENEFESHVVALIEDESQHKILQRGLADVRRRECLYELRANRSSRYIVDLVAALRPLTLTDAEQMRLADPVAEYESLIDERLQAWRHENIPLTRIMRENCGQAGGADPEKYKKCMDALNAFQKLIEELISACDDHMPRIADALEPANRLAFIEAVDRMVYPEAFEQCPAEFAAEALKYVEEIPIEQRAAIDAICAEYVPVRDQLRHEVLDIVRKWRREDDSPLKRKLAAVDWTQENGRDVYRELLQQHPANPLLERKHDFAIETVRRMRALFTDDEFARLPLALRLALEW